MATGAIFPNLHHPINNGYFSILFGAGFKPPKVGLNIEAFGLIFFDLRGFYGLKTMKIYLFNRYLPLKQLWLYG
jgi:hypothetical protein